MSTTLALAMFPLLSGLPLLTGLQQGVTPKESESSRWHTLEVTDAEGNSSSLRYILVVPEVEDPQQPIPCLLALPPGRQDEAMVETGLDLYFQTEALARGWAVVSPAASAGSSFTSGSELLIPALLDQVAAKVPVEGNRFHLAGVSNGGRGALRVAGLWPERFCSVTVLPGALTSKEDEARLAGFAHLPIAFHFGGNDTDWRDATLHTVELLEGMGAQDVMFEEHPGEGHVLDAALAPDLFDYWESLRKHAAVQAKKIAAATAVLDQLHRASAAGDADGYLAQFAPGAVFIGTDPKERWELGAFRAYVQQRFSKGQNWTYTVKHRHVYVGRSGKSAWFDEALENERYGATRGSGVLVKSGGAWRVAQYVLSLSVPDSVAPDVVERIRAGTPARK